ncbi:MAG: NAD(P)-binding domain-containing protein, partial [Malacoplasma sp.]|nr:NAD(P)-binding domain-containing protein [Malacoplasma sp.]
MNKRICILGTGAWATALGIRLSLNGATVFMYGVDIFEVNDINSGYNKKYFGEKKFISSLSATTDLSTAIGDSKFIILAFPSNYLIEVLRKLRTIISRNSNVILINTIKGLDQVTHDVLSKTIKKELKGYKAKIVTLSGPSLASDVFDLKPTIVNISGKNKETVSSVINLFN